MNNNEKQRVVLRYMEPADVQALFCMENDPQTWQFTRGSEAPYSRAQIEYFVCQAPRSLTRDGQLRLIVECQGEVVGAVDLYDYDATQRMAWVAVLVYPASLRGRGIGAAALAELVDRCRGGQWGVDRLRAEIGAGNEASAALFAAAGFVPVGDVKGAEGQVVEVVFGSTHLDLGRRGEQAAADYLAARGFEVVERNWRATSSGGSRSSVRHGEIDIVARRGGALYFVEVKSRSGGALDGDFAPQTALTPQKMERLTKICDHYAEQSGFAGEIFMMLITVNFPHGSSTPVICHYPL